MTRARLSLFAPCLALLTLAVGCGDSKSDGGLYEESAGTVSATSPTSDSAADSGLYESGGEGSGDPSASASASDGDPSGDPTAGDSAADSGADAGDSGAEGGDPVNPEPGQLTAGEWRDLDHWQFWQDLLQQPAWAGMPARWGFATQERFAVVVESDGKHVADADVTLLAGQETVWSARTDAHGEAELFAGLFAAAPEGARSLQVTVAGKSTVVEAVTAGGMTPIVVPVDVAEAPAQVLDLMFVIDTTGSMGDELSYLQVELADVIDRVRKTAGQDFKFRVSVNFYRDSGDEYLVKSFPFTEDIDLAIEDLNQQSANGGGDWPEAVDAALSDAIDAHDWSESAVARLCFIVLDAPPHEGSEVLADVQGSVAAAAERGVRIVPLAASGVDKELEFLLRFTAIATGGTYTFLTNDSGIGGNHVEPTIGEYQVEILNDLLVRVISAALIDK
ncbi:VWA domain-containing protein [Nannocystis sp.]|uniref:VWA domain-containing protein n=1 Tax=Nannocystis sp. TaxID=1962667 RepID=UPI0024277CFC|nr:VWA domain-containing protein [Nannocystis sp.]MBK7826354.1 VWA domain-containing protein [Nannocystis sp.]MBK9757871.1 VWA domain-containing protein [Nannocystis sp.]